MKIVCLIENTAGANHLKSEFGLSFYTETESHKILFDMGAGSGFMENASQLGIDLSQVDIAILSHGHYDHGGGLRTFLEHNDSALIYVQEGAFGDFYSKKQQGYVYIGLDKELEYHPRMIKVQGNLVIDHELQLLSDVSGKKEWVPESNATLVVKTGTDYERDSFPHEQNLLVSCSGANILFSGCAHCGILNILERCRQQTGIVPDRVIGGFHLLNPRTGKSVDSSVLQDLAFSLCVHPTVYHTCHCTGMEAFEYLHALMGNKIYYMSTGSEMFL